MGSLETIMPEADLLIVGIGPAGGALAAFAAQYGNCLVSFH
jgi:flavin-dependent dehydrogenase